jgi:hypothetical protein
MTTHPKREYTPKEIRITVARLRSDWGMNYVQTAANMLECLASQLAAQKSDNAQLQYALEQSEAKWIAAQKREGESALPNDGRMLTLCCCGKSWDSTAKPDCACVNQPPFPDQDREVSP